jgi:UDP:flavonoid glycosyltransferase YjiC (YdhE family)
MKKSLLIIPASFKSHVLPAISIAELLPDYEIFISVMTDPLANLVEKNGHKAIVNSVYRFGAEMENRFIVEHRKQRLTFLNFLVSSLKNETFNFRKNELASVINEIKPSAVIIDIFYGTDYLPLKALDSNIKVIFFNPMPSTYQLDGFPIVSESNWIRDKILDKTTRGFNQEKNIKVLMHKWLLKRELSFALKSASINTNDISQNNVVAKMVFKNVPELVLIPLDFEVSRLVKQPQQYYMGLCQKITRVDTDLDDNFKEKWQIIINMKENGNSIIYCSFGTYYSGSDKHLLDFFERIVGSILSIPNTILVCSVNRFIIEYLEAKELLNNRIYAFSNVPQNRVLEKVDVFITHGGMGSIKESIYHQVPMLVYPINLTLDQPGNALKVELHGLGLRGLFGIDRTETIKNKVSNLLKNINFKENVRKFKDASEKEYSSESLKKTLNYLLK